MFGHTTINLSTCGCGAPFRYSPHREDCGCGCGHSRQSGEPTQNLPDPTLPCDLKEGFPGLVTNTDCIIYSGQDVQIDGTTYKQGDNLTLFITLVTGALAKLQ